VANHLKWEMGKISGVYHIFHNQRVSWGVLAKCIFFRRFIGVADIASVRFSLPAQLLEPTPNLEYWNYLDQPSTFVAIGDSDDALDRMLEVLRFWFTKVRWEKGNEGHIFCYFVAWFP